VSEVRIAAESRAEFGKGAARRTRRAGKVPAVLYGHGKAPRHVSLPGHELMLALKGGPNTLLRLDLGDDTELALPRAVVRDPIKGFLQHLDLLVVVSGEKVSVSIPVSVTGTAEAGTIVDLQLPSLPVEAEATHIPSSVEVSVDGLVAGSSISAGDVALPAGVTLTVDPDHVVVQVLSQSAQEEAEPEVEAAEGEAGEESADSAESSEPAEG
jgi:large subunit ribosomal protein L25